jgi:hypothetical protein
MPRLSPVDAVGPSFARVGAMLFHPFRLRTWLKMGFIGWLAGGLVTASLNFNFSPQRFPAGQFPSDPWKDLDRVFRNAVHSIHFAQFAGFMALLMFVLVIGLIFSLIFTYLFSRFRFILFDAVVSGEVQVGRGWHSFRDPANRYFGFWLIYSLLSWAAAGLIVGLPVWRAYKSGVFEGDQPAWAFFELLASVALGLLAFAAVSAIVTTLVKDFVMPLMALDNLSVGRAFSVLWQYMAAEPGAWAGYIGMKFIFALVTGIGLAIVGILAYLILLLLLAIPVGLLIMLGIFAMKASAGLGITIFILAGLLAIAACFCLALCLAAPVSIFFAAYAFYFFGGRYPRLGGLLWPQPAPPSPQTTMAVAAPAS